MTAKKDTKSLTLTEIKRRRKAISARIRWLEKRDRELAQEMRKRI